MKIISGYVLLSILFLFSQCKPDERFIELTNPLSVDRKSEVVKLDRAKLEKQVGVVPDGYTMTFYERGNTLVSQEVDVDKDGNWDQVLLLLHFKSNEVKSIRIKPALNAEIKPTKSLSHVHFGVGATKADVRPVEQYTRQGDPRTKRPQPFFQMEGPAWENDKVGFRMYFDPRNGIDIFGKTTSSVVLSGIGINGDYHTKGNWGMDILKVGNSLGAGAIAIGKNDSIARVTGYNKAVFQIAEKGPILSQFRMNYPSDTIMNIPLNITHNVSIRAGDWFYTSDIKIDNLQSDMNLVTGIVNLKKKNLNVLKSDGYTCIYTYGNQSENGDNLGMALITSDEYFQKSATIPTKSSGITDTHIMSFKSGESTRFHFLTGWEASDSVFSNKAGFESVIESTMHKMANPITIKY